jgi:hypothetical protein
MEVEVTPEGLRKRAQTMYEEHRGDIAIHLMLAAKRLEELQAVLWAISVDADEASDNSDDRR